MKNGSGKKIAYVLIAAVFIVILCLGIMSRLNIIGKDNGANENETVLASWSSEPIGQADFYTKIEYEKSEVDGNKWLTFNYLTASDDVSNGEAMGYNLEHLKNYTYSDFSTFNFAVKDIKNDDGYFAFLVPSDCKTVILNDVNEFPTQDVEIKISDEIIKFRICVGVTSIKAVEEIEKENIVQKVICVDDEGKSHDCTYDIYD